VTRQDVRIGKAAIEGTLEETMDTAERLLRNVFAKESVVWMNGARFDANIETVVMKLPVAANMRPRQWGLSMHPEPYLFIGKAKYKHLWVDVWGTSPDAEMRPDIWVQDDDDFQGGCPLPRWDS
jgi:hypothetical protein